MPSGRSNPRFSIGLLLCMCALLVSLSRSPLFAQGGGGGFGGGGFGGGQGGTGRTNAAEADVYMGTNILTPGDIGEWALTIRDGETIIVRISTTNFDPVAQIVGPDGKVLAENDDIRLGEQDSLLLYHFPKGGAYKVIVKASKMAGGGQYSFTMRRFIATDVRIGARTASALGRNGLQWLRFPAEAGQTLVVTMQSAGFTPQMEIYAPNGEKEGADAAGESFARGERFVFLAEEKGNYHLRIASGGGRSSDSFAVTVAAAHVIPTKIGDNNPVRPLEAGGLDIWTFQGTTGDIIRISAKANGTNVNNSIRYVPPANKQEAGMADTNSAPVVLLPSDRKASGEIVAQLNRTGSYQVTVSQPLGQEANYTFAASRPLKPWPANGEPSGALPLGGTDYWAVEGKAGQILRFEGLSEQFDASMDFYGPNGERITSNDDGGSGRNALLTSLLTTPGRYLLRIHAFGDGGSGTYRLRRTLDPVRPLKMDTKTQGTVGSGGSDIWSFTGKAGQIVIISARSADFDTIVHVFGPDGVEVAGNEESRAGTDSLLSVRLPLEGTYTLWVYSRSGGGKYSIHLINEG